MPGQLIYMRLPILAATLKSAYTLLLALGAGMLAFQLLIASTYKQFGDLTTALFQQLPREWMALLKMQPGMSLGGDANSYLALGYYHPLFLILGSAIAITLGARALAGEIDRGTILYLLARPVPRWQVVASKALALLPATGLVAAGAVAGTALGSRLMGIEVDLTRFVLAGLNAWGLFAAIGAIALLASSLGRSTGEAAGWAGGFAIISFFVDFLADLWEPARTVEPLSIFDYYTPSEVIHTAQLPGVDLAVLIVVGVAAVVLAMICFSRRDIA